MKLKSRTRIERQTCWDITVKDNSNFIANGIVVHNSNAGVRYNVLDDSVTPQKRTSDLGGNAGHFGFVEHVKAYEDFYRERLGDICKKYGTDSVVVFGEWCGEGVQKSVAVSELSKRFVVFEVLDAKMEKYLDAEVALQSFRDKDKNIFNIRDYPTFIITVDTRWPEIVVEKINKLVDEVEKCCPVSKAMLLEEKPEKCEEREGYLGEGIVFTSEDGLVCWKAKGEKHSKGGGKRATVDPIKAQNVKEFVDKVVTEDRLQQCYDTIASDHGGVCTMKQIGDLMRWIFNDIMDEEGDALAHNNLSKKDVSGAIANTARPWFINKINSF